MNSMTLDEAEAGRLSRKRQQACRQSDGLKRASLCCYAAAIALPVLVTHFDDVLLKWLPCSHRALFLATSLLVVFWVGCGATCGNIADEVRPPGPLSVE